MNTTRVQKWGNSLAVRIPKPIAVELGIEDNSEVQLAYADGKLVISPPPLARFSLHDLLAGITKKNKHDGVDWGYSVGREAW